MWKLGLVCLQRANPGLRADSLGQIDAYNMDDEEDADTKQLVLQIEMMVTTVVDAFVDNCRRVFFDEQVHASDPIVIDSLTQCEAQIRACHTTLTALELPVATLSSLSDLLVDFRSHTVNQLFRVCQRNRQTDREREREREERKNIRWTACVEERRSEEQTLRCLFFIFCFVFFFSFPLLSSVFCFAFRRRPRPFRG